METHSITLNGVTKSIDTANGLGLLAVEGVCYSFGYQVTIDGQPNPESKAQFAIRMAVEEFFLKHGADYQEQLEIDAAMATAKQRRDTARSSITIR